MTACVHERSFSSLHTDRTEPQLGQVVRMRTSRDGLLDGSEFSLRSLYWQYTREPTPETKFNTRTQRGRNSGATEGAGCSIVRKAVLELEPMGGYFRQDSIRRSAYRNRLSLSQ